MYQLHACFVRLQAAVVAGIAHSQARNLFRPLSLLLGLVGLLLVGLGLGRRLPLAEPRDNVVNAEQHLGAVYRSLDRLEL